MSREVELRDLIRPGTTRGLDFVILEELRKRTGITPQEALKFALGEMLCKGGREQPKPPLSEAKEEIDVLVGMSGFHRCPKCGHWFQYDPFEDIGRLVKCRYCMASLRLRATEES